MRHRYSVNLYSEFATDRQIADLLSGLDRYRRQEVLRSMITAGYAALYGGGASPAPLSPTFSYKPDNSAQESKDKASQRHTGTQDGRVPSSNVSVASDHSESREIEKGRVECEEKNQQQAGGSSAYPDRDKLNIQPIISEVTDVESSSAVADIEHERTTDKEERGSSISEQDEFDPLANFEDMFKDI